MYRIELHVDAIDDEIATSLYEVLLKKLPDEFLASARLIKENVEAPGGSGTVLKLYNRVP